MKILEKIRNSGTALKNAFSRFPAATVSLLGFWLIFSMFTVTEFDDRWFIFLMPVFLCGAFVAVAVSLTAERYAGKIKMSKCITLLVPVVFEIIWYILSFVIKEEYYIIACVGIGFSMILFSVWNITSSGKELTDSAHTLKRLGFAFLAALVVLIGVSICIGAFIMLVFDFNSSYKLFLLLLEFCLVFGMFVLLSGLPCCDNKSLPLPKAYKAIVLHTELPIYFALTAVLYIYLLKMIVTRDLPSGGVNPYVSVASAAYIFNIFAAGAYADTSKLAKFFMKFGGLLMLPLIAIQCVTLGIRLYHYGLTTSRMMSVCFIAVTLLFAFGSFVKFIGAGKPLIFAAVLVFVITCTPLNILDIPVYQQMHTLKCVLERNEMLDGDTVIPSNNEISDEDKAKIISCHRYIDYHSINTPEFFEKISEQSIGDIYGFEVESAEAVEHCWYNNQMFAGSMFDISEYSYIYDAGYSRYDYSNMVIEVDLPDGTAKKYSLKPVIDYLFRTYGTDGYRSDLADGVIALDENTDFYYEGVGCSVNKKNGEIDDVTVEGFVLVK